MGNSTSVLIALFVALVIYFGGMTLVDKVAPKEQYKKNMLDRIRKSRGDEVETTSSTMLKTTQDSNPIVRSVFSRPGMSRIHDMVIQAGFEKSQSTALIALLALLAGVTLAASSLLPQAQKFMAVPVGLAVSYVISLKVLGSLTVRRRSRFIDQFPDALDMMVRSVKSGYPMNSALQMVAENMPQPISGEFKLMVDEIAYGRPFSDSLKRMAARIAQADVKFFTVVLSVQQETGGNLSEVLSNLSDVLRKRKQLRLKIRALTSEGRTTMWIMAALPVALFGILTFLTPEHLYPLYETTTGHWVLGTAIGMVLTGIVIVKQMIKVDI